MTIGLMREALAEADEAFADHPDVTLVGIGEKHSGGKNIGEYAIVLFVQAKGNPTGTALPGTVRLASGRFRTDVVELPAASLALGNAELDGADILIDDARGKAGTLGFVAREDRPPWRLFGITNAHVVSAVGQDARGASVSALLGGARSVIGHVSHHTVLYTDGRLNKPDVALVELNASGATYAAEYQIEPWRNQPIDGVSSLSPAPQAGSRRPHAYASKVNGPTEIVSGTSPVEVSARPMRDPDSGGLIRFGRLFHTRVGNAVRAGHSGSALTRLRASGTGRTLCGLVVGGRGPDLFAFAWGDVAATIRDDFGIDI